LTGAKEGAGKKGGKSPMGKRKENKKKEKASVQDKGKKQQVKGRRKSTLPVQAVRSRNASPFRIPSPIRRWGRMGSAVWLTMCILRPSGFMTSIISWHRMRIRTPSLRTGVIS
jgi:hypothetical protein